MFSLASQGITKQGYIKYSSIGCGDIEERSASSRPPYISEGSVERVQRVQVCCLLAPCLGSNHQSVISAGKSKTLLQTKFIPVGIYGAPDQYQATCQVLGQPHVYRKQQQEKKCFLLGQYSMHDRFVTKSLDSVVSDMAEFCEKFYGNQKQNNNSAS